jgi:SAM-dependent methyltransferase
MDQTPLSNDYNPDIFRMLPNGLKRVVEVGCSNGALAKAYRKVTLDCEYIGIEIDEVNADISRKSCTKVICGNIETLRDEEFDPLFPSDCWIFGDTLEHLTDPWAVLRRIRARMAKDSFIVACIPNAQHWSVQTNLMCGLFRYRDKGLFDRTHLRWFTRITIIELFGSTGYKIIDGIPRAFDDPTRHKFIPSIRSMAIALGVDPEQTVNDSLPDQYVVKAVPV